MQAIIEPGAPVPDCYAAHIDAMCGVLRFQLAQHGHANTFVVIGSLTKDFTTPVGGIENMPFELGCLAITEVARTFGADFIMLCRTTMAANAGTKEQAQEYAKKYKRPEDVPGAQLVAYVSLETYEGVWVGVKPIVTIDGKATVGDIRLGWVEPTMPTLNLLPRRDTDTLQ